jgi:soluble lytic murein transglycosylase
LRVKAKPFVLLLLSLSVVGAGAKAASPEEAGRLLADGKQEQAAAAASGCDLPGCALTRARALFGLGQYDAAAQIVSAARTHLGALEAHGTVLQGEALLYAGHPGDALEPLRRAIALDGAGPSGLRAAGLLADALLAAGDAAAAMVQARTASALPLAPPELRAAMAWDEAQALRALGTAHAREAAEAFREFWLQHPDHPAAEQARAEELALGAGLPPLTGHELLARASRLLAAGQPAEATAQAKVATAMLDREPRAEAELLFARALAADGKRGEATSALEEAWAHGAPHVAVQAGMLLARDRARHGQDAQAMALADALARKYPAAPEAEESALFVARLLLDGGQRSQARARLSKLAARSGPNAAVARWTFAWLSYREKLPDAAKRFAAFAAGATSDPERAQGTYWQARATRSRALFQRAADLDPLGWYGILAQQRLGTARPADPRFPPTSLLPKVAAAGDGSRLTLARELASLGLLAESAAEADVFVREHPGDASAAALPVYESARRFDRALLLAESLLGGRGPKAPRPILEAAYPTAFPEEIGETAARTGLDPYFLLAVMRRESLFKPDTRSAAGAVGLLQLLPVTARRAAAVLGRPPLRDDELTVPATAIDLGTWYLAELVGRFGNPAVALAAYNAGPRVALAWATAGAGRPLDEWVEDIPYRETRRYVKVVAGAWSAYRILAGGSPPRLPRTVPPPRDGANF